MFSILAPSLCPDLRKPLTPSVLPFACSAKHGQQPLPFLVQKKGQEWQIVRYA